MIYGFEQSRGSGGVERRHCRRGEADKAAEREGARWEFAPEVAPTVWLL